MTNEEFIKSISLEGEEWRDVVGYEGYYCISSFGRIMSKDRHIVTKTNKTKFQAKRLMVPQLNNNGYLTVILRKCGSIKHQLIHRLVAIHFLDNPDNYPEIDHINGDKTCNILSNLRWCDRTINMRNPITTKRLSKSASLKINERNPNSKPIVAIKGEEVRFFPSMCEAGRCGFNQGSVSAACLNKIRHHKGYRFMFLSDYEKFTNKSKNDLSVPTDNT